MLLCISWGQLSLHVSSCLSFLTLFIWSSLWVLVSLATWRVYLLRNWEKAESVQMASFRSTALCVLLGLVWAHEASWPESNADLPVTTWQVQGLRGRRLRKISQPGRSLNLPAFTQNLGRVGSTRIPEPTYANSGTSCHSYTCVSSIRFDAA